MESMNQLPFASGTKVLNAVTEFIGLADTSMTLDR